LPDQISFFVMTGEALKSLGDELQILAGETSAREAIERYGFRCGEGLAQKLGLGTVSSAELKDLLPDLLIETGLGRSRAVDVSEDRIVIDFEDSVEAGAIGKAAAPSCRFTSGYLAGLLSSLLDKRMQGAEESCISAGAASCRHIIAPSKADFKPANEAMAASACKYCLNNATGFLIKEETGEKSYEVFTEHVTHGHQGLCITRDFPAKIRKRYGLEKTPIIWLSTAETTEVTIAPQNLSALYYQIESFLKKSEKGIVLLSGMEYLISQNSYQSVLKFIQLLNELIAVRSAILLVSLSPLTLDEKDLKTLERELEAFAPKEKIVNMMD
jgi:predicted hydrocarbon binding protein